MATVTTPSQADQVAMMRAQNMMARQAIVNRAAEFTQQIYSNSFKVNQDVQGTIVNIIPRNVGLVLGFTVRVDMDVVVPAGVTLTRTPYGAMNLLSRVEFIDLSNFQRIQTSGWHLAIVNSARYRRVVGSAFVTDSPTGMGSTRDVGINVPATIAASTTQRISFVYDVPLAYSRDDLRGAIYAAVVSASMALNLTINPAIVTTGTDATGSVYSATGAGTIVQNAKVTCYQRFYEQLPGNSATGGPLLPFQDLSTTYQLQQTSLTGLAPAQDFPIPFSNFRQFLSTTLIYDNGGVLNPGNDVNYVAMQTANTTTFSKKEPWLLQYENRNAMHDDLPLGVFHLDHRRRPVDTAVYGNQSILVNPITVANGAQILVGWESMAMQAIVSASGSLAAG